MPTASKISSNTFPKVYEALNVNLAELGYVMLDLAAPSLDLPANLAEGLYESKVEERFWINGYGFSKNPHMTLLYGLLESAQEWKDEVDAVLTGWECPAVRVDHVGFFNSPFEDDPYYCIVAHLELSPEIIEGNKRLELLPHINTYLNYKPHVTIAYVKKDEVLRNSMIRFFQQKLKGRMLKVTGVNYGGDADKD